MKTKFICIATILSLCASLHPAAAQGTAFTYQGRLNSNANPVNGNYDLTFSLYNAGTGGMPIGNILTNTAVDVSNGLFTVTVDFGTVFSSTPNWLQIGVRTNATGNFSALTPRQPLTPTPYAIYAESANAAGLIGTVPAGDFNGTYGGTLTLNNAGNSFTGNGTGLTNLNANLLGGLATSNFWQTTGNAGTSPGASFLGTMDGADVVFKAHNIEGLRLTTHEDVILQRPSQYADFSERNGLGVYGFTSDIDTGYRLFANQNVLGPVLYGEGGGGLGVISASSQQILALYWNSLGVTVNLPTMIAGTVTATGFANGGVPLGDFFAGPSAGNSTMTGQYNTADGYNTLSTNTTGGYNLAAGAQALYSNTTGDYNTAVGDDAMKMNIGGATDLAIGYQALENGTNLNYSTAVGYQSLRNSSTLFVYDYDGIGDNETNGDFNTALGYQSLINTTTGQGNIAIGWRAGTAVTTGNNNIYVGNTGTAGDSGIIRIGTPGIQTQTYVSGQLNCSSINITGGSDLAEPFAISKAQQPVTEGEVVVIDEANPGQLKLTDQPYDTHVAGVVSGGNGIHPGIQMHQEGSLGRGENVALSGRVYVQADTSNGAIKPGDLLTTSGTPGHAMKVSDHARAAGAILGKAMSALNVGQGMVLVLVTLQ